MFLYCMASSQLDAYNTRPIPNIGIIISDLNTQSPNITEFAFILTNPQDSLITHGQYCIAPSIEGLVIGKVDSIYITNNYFQNAQTVKNFDHAQVNIQNYFPSNQWECHIANVTVLGLIRGINEYQPSLEAKLFTTLDKVAFPVTPGNQVHAIFPIHLEQLIGFDNSGLEIGALKNYDLPVKLNINRLFSKHLAILAQSGAGKSYLISVLIEELLLHAQYEGSPAMILMDVHGEYSFSFNAPESRDLDKNPSNINNRFHNSDVHELSRKIQRYNASFLQIGVPSLNEYDFKHYQPKISYPQVRELRKAIQICKNNAKSNSKDSINKGYDISDLVHVLETEMEINSNVKDALIGWLEDLHHLKIFSHKSNPAISDLARVNHLVILDFSSLISQRKKAILVHYISSQLFKMRRRNQIAPFILFLEEAHNFLPTHDSKTAYAKSILETIAREGRKFFAQLVLVSQRPVHLSTTVLSQCNTQIIMRITNPNDLQHIKESSEHLTHSSVKLITTLPTGNAIIVGRALNFPVFVQIRSKYFYNDVLSENLTDIISRFNFQQQEPVYVELQGETKKYTQAKYTQENFLEADPHHLDEKS